MATKKVFVGSMGPFLYDDNKHSALETNGQVDDASALEPEPSDPPSGEFVIWASDGTNYTEGDLMYKYTTSAGSTTTHKIQSA